LKIGFGLEVRAMVSAHASGRHRHWHGTGMHFTESSLVIVVVIINTKSWFYRRQQ